MIDQGLLTNKHLQILSQRKVFDNKTDKLSFKASKKLQNCKTDFIRAKNAPSWEVSKTCRLSKLVKITVYT